MLVGALACNVLQPWQFSKPVWLLCRDTTPVATRRSAVEEEGDGAHNAAEQNRGVDLPGDSIDHPAAWTATPTAPQAAGLDLQGGSSSLGDLPAAGAVAPTSKPQSSLSVTQPGVKQLRILQDCSVVN